MHITPQHLVHMSPIDSVLSDAQGNIDSYDEWGEHPGGIYLYVF